MTQKAINPQALAQALIMLSQQGVRVKDVSSTPTGVNAHGPGGLFSSMGLSRPLFTAMSLPLRGLQGRLPVRYSNDTDPLYGLITGVTASTGSNPTGPCDDPKTAGNLKLCTHSFVFGRLSRQTKVWDIESAGKIINRGEFTDLQILGGLPTDNPMVPSLPNAALGQAAAKSASKALYELGVAWMRDFARLLYEGNPTNNTAGGGYKEFRGLDLLINTGYQDAETGVLCPAADSIVVSFGNKEIRANATLIVRTIASIYRRLKHLAVHTNMAPVKWVISMPFSMFYELTEIWPISYATTAATVVPTGATLFVGSEDQLKRRDEMRGDLYNYTGQFLLIDGERVDVVLDDAISETQNADGTFTADIYFVPLTALGSEPVTFIEHFNYDGPGAAAEMASVLAPVGSFYSSDGGRFLWHKKPPTNTCVQVAAWTSPRVMLITPYLGARLTDITYAPIDHERAWDPADPSFWVNGGKTAGDTTDPSYYAPTR